MKKPNWLVGAIALCFVSTTHNGFAGENAPREKGGGDLSGPYEVVPNWPQPFFSDDMTWGRTSSVFAQSADRVFVLMSGIIPKSWRQVSPADKEGYRKSGPGWGEAAPQRRTDDESHCASSRPALTAWKGKKQEHYPWYCQVDAKGKIIDSIVDFHSGEPIPGAKWEHVLTVYNRDGKLIEDWSQWNSILSHPHFIMINPYDPDKHVWVVDTGMDQIFKFTNDGKKRVLSIGEAHVPGYDKTHLATPTMIAFLPNGDMYVSDGYSDGGGGTRVVKFDKNGKYLMEWGKRGTGPGEFNTLHSIAIDATGKVYVADRTNRRIQVFDANGKFLDMWPNIPFPNHIAISKSQHLWEVDGYLNKLVEYDLEGHALSSFGSFGNLPGYLWGTHYFHTDNEGNLYTADVFGGHVQKFRPRPDADPKRLIGQLTSPGQ